MPLYEYRCESCGEQTEVVRKFSDEPLTVCSSCGGTLKKLISSPAIQFKGSGFYITDYAKPSSGESKSEGASKEAGKAESTSGSKSADSKSTDSKSTDSKPDSKPARSGSAD